MTETVAHDVFISYSAPDKAVADAACATLEQRRIRCWIAPRDAPAGTPWASALVGAIKHSKVFVLILSRGSNGSAQVIREIDEAVGDGIPVVPLRIDDVDLSDEMRYYIKSVHWLDALTPPLERHLEHLADSVEALLGVPPRAPSAQPVQSAEPPEAPAPGQAGARRPSARSVLSRMTRRRWIAAALAALTVIVGVATAVWIVSASGPDGPRTLSFTIPSDGNWSEPAPGTYHAAGQSDTFAWSDEEVEGDLVVELDVTSDFAEQREEGHGEASVIVYGDGIGYTRGSLIFTITGYWQAIVAHSPYESGNWLVFNEHPLDVEPDDTFSMRVEVVDGRARLYVDDEQVATAGVPSGVDPAGRIGLAKYGGSGDVSFADIRIDTSPSD